MLAILVVAAYLRLKGMSWGLPYSYQNPDEKVVLLGAFRIARGHPNPEFFYYPSMLFNMIGAVTWAVSKFYAPHGVTLISPVTFVTDPTPYYLIGRAVVAVCGVASVYLVYRLGKEAFSRPVGLLAALFLAVEPLHVRYSHVAVTDVPATMFGLLALLLFVRAARRREARTLLLGRPGRRSCHRHQVQPRHARRARRDRLLVCLSRPARPRTGCAPWPSRSLRRVAAPMLARLSWSARPSRCSTRGTSWATSYRQNHIVAHGWLGFENVHNGYWYNLSVNLAGSLGVVLLALGLAGIVLALVKRTRADLILVPYVIVYYLYVSSWHELMDRYLLPIVPLLIVLAVRACVALAARARGAPPRAWSWPSRRPCCWGPSCCRRGPRSTTRARSSGTDVRTVAKAWIEQHLPAQRGDRHGAVRAAAGAATSTCATTPRPA